MRPIGYQPIVSLQPNPHLSRCVGRSGDGHLGARAHPARVGTRRHQNSLHRLDRSRALSSGRGDGEVGRNARGHRLVPRNLNPDRYGRMIHRMSRVRYVLAIAVAATGAAGGGCGSSSTTANHKSSTSATSSRFGTPELSRQQDQLLAKAVVQTKELRPSSDPAAKLQQQAIRRARKLGPLAQRYRNATPGPSRDAVAQQIGAIAPEVLAYDNFGSAKGINEKNLAVALGAGNPKSRYYAGGAQTGANLRDLVRRLTEGLRGAATISRVPSQQNAPLGSVLDALLGKLSRRNDTVPYVKLAAFRRGLPNH